VEALKSLETRIYSMLKMQVLIATMHQQDLRKYNEMNLHTDAVFANQADRTQYVKDIIDGNNVEMITTSTRGVGKNRNIALLYSTGDILLIADDDITYVDGYEGIVLNAFEELKDADGIVFNINTIGQDPDRRKNDKISRLNFLNAFNYGAVRLAIRKRSVQREGITFNENFGGGTIYSAGEDSLFIRDLLKHKKLYLHCVAAKQRTGLSN
jgi:glycosyltransferase involved in cell wall biosynthesis